MDFNESLKSGKVVILQTGGINAKGQIGVQFIQKIKVPTSGTPNAALSIFQATNPNSNSSYDGMTSLVCWMSVHKGVIEKAGLAPETNYRDLGQVVYASDAFGADIQIAMCENTANNEAKPSLLPKIPGASSTEVICLNGQPVYRHTAIVVGTPAANSIQGFTPDEQCTESEGRYFLTGAVTERKPQANFPDIFTNASTRANAAVAASDDDAF